MKTKTTLTILQKKHLPINTQNTKESKRFEFLNEITYYINKQKEKGDIVYDFTTATPLQNPPKEVLDVLRKNINNENLKNYPKSGSRINKNLIEAYSKWYEACNGWSIAENNIIRDNNSFNIIKDILKLLRLKENSKKLLIHAPIFGYFQCLCDEIGIETQIVNTDNSTYSEGIDLNKALENSNVGAILFNSPANPTGEIMDEKFSNSLYKKLKSKINCDKDFYVIVDEVYLNLVHEEKHFSLALQAKNDPTFQDRYISLNSIGKSSGISGLRDGRIAHFFGYLF